MIPYLEIRDKYTLKTVAIVEPQECWLELSWQDIGEFEIYCRASKANLNALQPMRYITIPNKRFVWVITSVQYTFTAGGARMISAKGYEAKWLLTRRCVLMPTELSGTITEALYRLVNQSLGTVAEDYRKIVGFEVDTNNLLISLTGTQAPRGNLREVISPLLKQYNCGDIVELVNGALKYRIFTGEVRTQSVKFSQSLDNLLSSEYYLSEAEKATYAFVVAKPDDTEYGMEADNGGTGIDRAEIIIESSISKKYQDADGVDLEADDAEYISWLSEEGYTKLAEHTPIEDIKGEIDLISSNYIFDIDFFLGDTVKVQDEYFNFYKNTRILKYTFKQDANGYGEEAEYGG